MIVADAAVPTALDRALVAGCDTDLALIDGHRRLTFGDLRSGIDEAADRLDLPQRSIVLISGSTSVELIQAYFAVYRAGHVPLLAGDHPDRLAHAWHPAALVSADDGAWSVTKTGHDQPALHPDLALLLSTSGSTGSPKLVRLSFGNIVSNARSIGEYLGLAPTDRGITTLPLHYCYGLSVLHAHLLCGASVVVNTASVVDPCFRRALVDHGVTNIAGVPYTYELAERAGAERLFTPSMRFLTVAGGRMTPDVVERWAARAEQAGVDLYLMYGQTEATARMAYLPPALARVCPGAIGVPIPGGELRVDAPGGELGEVGELVYRGDNVMMGYAVHPNDVELGSVLDELRTGDLGRYDPMHRVFHLTGRTSRFVKPFGLRIDLDGLESDLRAELGVGPVAVAGDDTGLAVVAPGADRDDVRRWLVERTNLPASNIGVEASVPIPRTASGKVDAASVLALAHPHASADDVGPSVANMFDAVLGCRRVTMDDTFVSLGGDSLDYVECSIRLERAIGVLPADWHLMPVDELESLRVTADAAAAPRRRRTAQVDTTVPLRAIAICTVVATHMRVGFVPGGAHLLLTIVGYNMSRFLLPVADARARAMAGLRTAARAAVPVLVWVAVGMVAFGAYTVPTLLLVNNYVGPGDHTRDLWDFWFIEAFVQLLLITIVVMSVPFVRRADCRWPFATPLVALAVALLFRYRLIEILGPGDLRFRTHGTAFFFVLGWLVHRSRSRVQRVATTLISAAVILGFFGRPERELYILGGVVLLVWWREVTLPRMIVPVVALVSTASMYILITHFTVWPRMIDLVGLRFAYPLTVAAGIAAWMAVRVTSSLLRPTRLHAAVALRALWDRRHTPLLSPNTHVPRTSS